MKASRGTMPIVVALFLAAAGACAAEPASQPAPNDWPQWRGPNRDGLAVNCPRLLDSWPKEGPPVLWKSEWIPAYFDGGSGAPVVADGKVFVYVNWKQPVGGGNAYRFITSEVLLNAGWLPDLPEDLAKKIETAWASPDRPKSTDWPWWEIKDAKTKEQELDAYLAKKPELDKYIKGLLATLTADESKKYGDYVKRRLCIDPRAEGYSWSDLVKLSKLQDAEYPSCLGWAGVLGKATGKGYVSHHFSLSPFFRAAWRQSYTVFDTVVCLDAATGKTLWKKDFPADNVIFTKEYSGFGSGAFETLGVCSTPAVWKDKCYAVGAMGLYCLSVTDGALLWQVKGTPQHFSPLVADGIVYSCGVAYDVDKGDVRWKNPAWVDKVRGNFGRFCSPLLWTSGGRKYVITTSGADDDTRCLDLQTGKLLWTVKGLYELTSGDLLVAGNRAYEMTAAGAEPLCKIPAAANGSISLNTAYQDYLYLAGGAFSCMDAKTGELIWKKTDAGVASFSTPIVADGKLILFHGWGESPAGVGIKMIKASPDEKYLELGSFNPSACSFSSPALADGKLYARLQSDCVVCYDLREHGVYLDGVTAGKDSLTFRFKQAGGGLVAQTLNDIVIAEGTGAARPAKAQIAGDSVVVDIKDAAMPFSVSYAGAAGTLAGKSGLSVPTFSWSEARVLKSRKCFDQTIMLTSDLPLKRNAGWNNPATYSIAGAKVTQVELDPTGRQLSLTTDKTWKPKDSVALTYRAFPVQQGDARLENLTFTVVEPVRASAKFAKADDATQGNWKGVYGAEGAIVAGDAAGAAPSCATVMLTNKEDMVPWAAQADALSPQKTGKTEARTVTRWTTRDYMDVEIEFADDKEHEVALYCRGARDMTVEVRDADTKGVLDTQTVKDVAGRYLVWNLKGSVTLRLTNNMAEEFPRGLAGGVFFGPAKPVASEKTADAASGPATRPN